MVVACTSQIELAAYLRDRCKRPSEKGDRRKDVEEPTRSRHRIEPNGLRGDDDPILDPEHSQTSTRRSLTRRTVTAPVRAVSGRASDGPRTTRVSTRSHRSLPIAPRVPGQLPLGVVLDPEQPAEDLVWPFLFAPPALESHPQPRPIGVRR